MRYSKSYNFMCMLLLFNQVITTVYLRPNVTRKTDKRQDSISDIPYRCQPLMPGMVTGDNLHKFIKKTIQPTSAYNRRSKQISFKLVRFLQSAKLNIKRILKGGSMGKGTHVKDKSDIDLIVYYNGIETVEELKEKMPDLLSTLKEVVLRHWRSELIFKDMTPFSVQFYLKNEDDDLQRHEVDLLPALDITQSKKGKSLAAIYQEMKDIGSNKERSAYSSCLSPLQVKFVKGKSNLPTAPEIKDFMRLLKYWSKIEVVPVRSYFLELFVIHLWRGMGQPQNIDMDETLKLVLHELENVDKIAISFTDNYNFMDYSSNVRPPYLMDPANPFRNVAPTYRDSQIVRRKATHLLERIKLNENCHHAEL